MSYINYINKTCCSRINEDQRKEADLYEESQGVKADPISKENMVAGLFDPLHAKLSMGKDIFININFHITSLKVELICMIHIFNSHIVFIPKIIYLCLQLLKSKQYYNNYHTNHI